MQKSYLSLLRERPANNFGIAFFIAVIITIISGAFILYHGKFESFQLINGNHNEYSDQFFKYFTHYGDGFMWAPLGLFCLFYKRKYLVAVIAGFIISTIITQLLKRVVFPDELRPITYISESFFVHTIDGVVLRRINSFPSGHTTTAFTMALIMAHMINKKPWSVILPLLAFLAGYSRIYLGQHFPTDVFAGMCIGILSAILSLIIFKSFLKNNSFKTMEQ